MYAGDLNFYFDVVQELIDDGFPPSLRNIADHLSPKGREREIATALQSLVADGRLIKVAAVLSFDGNDHATDLDYYYPASSY